MSCPELALLDSGFGAPFGSEPRHRVRAGRRHHDHPRSVQRLGHREHMGQHRPARDPMHDFGQGGLHPRPLPGGKHDDGQSGTIHAAVNASYDEPAPPPEGTLNPQPNPVELTFCCLIFPHGVFWANPAGAPAILQAGRNPSIQPCKQPL